MSIMTRVHGAVGENRLGYFQGQNSLLTIAIKTTGVLKDAATCVEFKETGVLQTLAEFKELYAVDPSKDIAATDAAYDSGGKAEAGDPSTVLNTTVEQRTFNGVAITSDALYVAAYAKQMNLRLLVDSVQQRCVVIGMSPSVSQNAAVTLATHASNHESYDKALAFLVGDTLSGVSILVERADTIDRHVINTYGQLTGVVEKSKELVEALGAVKFLKNNGTAAVVAGTNIAVKASRQVPFSI